MLDGFTKVIAWLLSRERSADALFPYAQLLPKELGGGVILQKNRGMTRGFAVELMRTACADDQDLEARSEALETALRMLPDGSELQIDVLRREVTAEELRAPRVRAENAWAHIVESARRQQVMSQLGGGVFENRVRLFLTSRPFGAHAGWVSAALSRRSQLLELHTREHQLEVLEFRGWGDQLRASLKAAGLSARPLDSDELVTEVRRSVNCKDDVGSGDVLPWQYLSARAAEEEIVDGVRHLRLGDRYVAVLSALAEADSVEPFCIESLTWLPFECRIVLGIQVLNQQLELRGLDAKRSRAKNWARPGGGGVTVDLGGSGGSVAEDLGAVVKADSVESVMRAMYAGQKRLLTSVNVIVWGQTEEELVRRVRQTRSEYAQAVKGSDLYVERTSGLNVWRSALPGFMRLSSRTHKLLSPEVADLAVGLFAGTTCGENLGSVSLYNPRTRGLHPLTVFGSKERVDARNILIVGKTGMGKSVFLNALAHAARIEGAIVWLLDKGASLRPQVEIGGGKTVAYSLSEDTDTTNPCEFELDEDVLQFLLSLIGSIVRTGRDTSLNPADEGRLAEVIRRVYQEKPQAGAVVLGDIQDALYAYRQAFPGAPSDAVRSMKEIADGLLLVTKGPMGRVLNRRSTRRLEDAKFVHLDYQGVRDERLLTLLLSCITFWAQRMMERVGRGVPKFLGLDEGKGLMSSEVGARQMKGLWEIPRVTRKHQMSFTTSSQSFADYDQSGLRDAVVKNCDRTVVLGPRHDFERLQEALNLSEKALERIRALHTVRGRYSRLVLVQPGGAEELELRMGPELLWLWTSHPPEVALRDETMDRFVREGVAASVGAVPGAEAPTMEQRCKWAAIQALAVKFPLGVETVTGADVQAEEEERLVA